MGCRRGVAAPQKVFSVTPRTFEERSCSQNRIDSTVFKQISVPIKLFDDIRRFDNNCEGVSEE